MTRSPRIPGVEKIELLDHRQAIPRLHAYVRASILDGTLPPGTKLSQVALAEQLGVSRTPLREVLRMLQEEGLVEFSPNQRMRVAGFDPEDLDSDYACRLLLESMALSMTLPKFNDKMRVRAESALNAMWSATESGNTQRWFDSHRKFHDLLTSGASGSIKRQLRSYADRSTRYLQIYQTDSDEWQIARHPEHVGILEAVVDGRGDLAVTRLAQHLATAALFVLDRSSPDYAPTAVPCAVSMACHGMRLDV
jgi:DNA-binding GntR family transcriptional regulator